MSSVNGSVDEYLISIEGDENYDNEFDPYDDDDDEINKYSNFVASVTVPITSTKVTKMDEISENMKSLEIIEPLVDDQDDNYEDDNDFNSPTQEAAERFISQNENENDRQKNIIDNNFDFITPREQSIDKVMFSPSRLNSPNKMLNTNKSLSDIYLNSFPKHDVYSFGDPYRRPQTPKQFLLQFENKISTSKKVPNRDDSPLNKLLKSLDNLVKSDDKISQPSSIKSNSRLILKSRNIKSDDFMMKLGKIKIAETRNDIIFRNKSPQINKIVGESSLNHDFERSDSPIHPQAPSPISKLSRATSLRLEVLRNQMNSSKQRRVKKSPALSMAADQLWIRLMSGLRTSGDAVSYKDLADIVTLSNNDSQKADLILHLMGFICILLGISPTWKSCRSTLFKELRPLQCFIKEIDPMSIPVKRVKKATAFFKTQQSVVTLESDNLFSGCAAFGKILRWIESFLVISHLLILADKRKSVDNNSSNEENLLKSSSVDSFLAIDDQVKRDLVPIAEDILRSLKQAALDSLEAEENQKRKDELDSYYLNLLGDNDSI